MKKTVFEKIEDVLLAAHRPIAAFEFGSVHLAMTVDHVLGGRLVDGRFYVGISEESLGRQLRKMREIGLVKSSIREGKSFKEYHLSSVIQPELFSYR